MQHNLSSKNIERPITVDCHVDTPWQWYKAGHKKPTQVTFSKMKEGGLDCAVFALYLSGAVQDLISDYAIVEAIHQQYRRCIVDNPDIEVVRNTGQARNAIKYGHTPIFVGLEGGRLILNSLPQLHSYSRLGIKYLTLTHNYNTDWADSATDVRQHRGLTKFGKRVVEECEKLGILVDVSHSSNDTFADVIGRSTKPVIASHSGCHALVNHPRNLTDRQIKQLAATGGVVHIPFARRFVGDNVGSIVDHINHAVQLVGINHVGIGSDLDGAEMIEGVRDVRDWKRVVVDALSNDGYSDTGINQIAGENTLRIFA